MSIYDLKENDVALVEYVSDSRITEMGLMKGAKIQVVRCGDPCIIQLNGCKLCIGHTDILVRPLIDII